MTHTDPVRELRDSLSGVAAPGRPALEAITARGRARQRRRTAGLAAAGTAGVAAVTAVVLGLTAPSPAPGVSTGTIRTAAFTLVHNADGTDTLTVSMPQMRHPAELQRALQREGIPALVKTDVSCSSTPALPLPANIGVVTLEHPDGRPLPKPGPAPGSFVVIPANAVNVINPARMPRGSELYFDYFSHGLNTGLIRASSYTCHADATPQTP